MSARRPSQGDRGIAAETNKLGFEPLSGPRGVADDLKKIPGVSPAIEKKLNDLGIFHCLADRRIVADRRA